MKNINKEILTYVILLLLGIILVILGCTKNNTAAEIMLNIGLSIISTVIIYFILKFLADDPMDSVVTRFDKLSEELSQSVDMLKSTRETGIINCWNTRSELPVYEWIAKISHSDGDVCILCYAMSFLVDDSEFDDAILKIINEGKKCRILFGDPKGKNICARTEEEQTEGNISERIYRAIARIQKINKSIPADNKIQLKYHDTPLYASIYVLGNKMLVTPQLYATRGALAPILEIKKLNSKHCTYNKYLDMFEEVWNKGVVINDV